LKRRPESPSVSRRHSVFFPPLFFLSSLVVFFFRKVLEVFKTVSGLFTFEDNPLPSLLFSVGDLSNFSGQAPRESPSFRFFLFRHEDISYPLYRSTPLSGTVIWKRTDVFLTRRWVPVKSLYKYGFFSPECFWARVSCDGPTCFRLVRLLYFGVGYLRTRIPPGGDFRLIGPSVFFCVLSSASFLFDVYKVWLSLPCMRYVHFRSP